MVLVADHYHHHRRHRHRGAATTHRSLTATSYNHLLHLSNFHFDNIADTCKESAQEGVQKRGIRRGVRICRKGNRDNKNKVREAREREDKERRGGGDERREEADSESKAFMKLEKLKHC